MNLPSCFQRRHLSTAAALFPHHVRVRKAALVFFWGPMERSVRVEGTVAKVSEEATAAYFRSRPRESQIGAWVSRQSSVVGSPEVLKAREWELIERFKGLDEIPVPDFWGTLGRLGIACRVSGDGRW